MKARLVYGPWTLSVWTMEDQVQAESIHRVPYSEATPQRFTLVSYSLATYTRNLLPNHTRARAMLPTTHPVYAAR
jgi:hypothetical protein